VKERVIHSESFSRGLDDPIHSLCVKKGKETLICVRKLAVCGALLPGCQNSYVLPSLSATP